jgi:hypothetical protein
MSLSSEVLLLDAKKAILEYHLQQYQLAVPQLTADERLLHLQRALHSAAGLLQDSLKLLGRIRQDGLESD